MEKELMIEGKKYISARRASEISGYNSDYLGQLCRSGKLDSKLISRTRFITEESLEKHKIDTQIGSKLKSEKKKILLKEEREFYDSRFFDKNQKALFEILKSDAVQGNLRSSLSEKVFNQKLISNSLIAVLVSVSMIAIVFDFHNLFLKKETVFLEEISTTISQNLESVIPSENFSLAGAYSLENIKNNFLRNYFSLKNKISKNLSIFKKEKDSLVFDSEEPTTTKYGFENQGSVLIPLPEGGEEDLQKVRNYLRNSFSDEIEIIPDGSGISGVIKPVFTDPVEEEYFYVMVPVR